jgi:hypothetical protein
MPKISRSRFWKSLFPAALLLSGCGSAQMATLQTQAKAYYDSIEGSPLRPYVLCGVGGGLEIFAIDGQRNPSPPYRVVPNENQTDTIFVTESHRTLFAFTKVDYYVASGKVEASDPARYGSNKAKLIQRLGQIVKADSGRSILRKKESFRRIEVHGLYADTLDRGDTVAIDNFFLDKRKIMVSVYYLNQGKEQRRFTDISEFQIVRRDFVERWTACADHAKTGR